MSVLGKHETFASVVNDIRNKNTASTAVGKYISPINGKPMKEYMCGDIPVMADLESRVVFPKFAE